MPTVSMLSSNRPAVGMKCGPAPVSIRITSDAGTDQGHVAGRRHPFAALPSCIASSRIQIQCDRHVVARKRAGTIKMPVAQHRDLAARRALRV